MSSTPTVYLVTGGARGIGLALVEELAKRPNSVVYAVVRNTALKGDNPLAQLAAKLPDVVIPVKISSGSEEDNGAAAALVKEKSGQVDVVIANAGVSSGIQPIATLTRATAREEFEINTLGPLVLYQAFASLLTAATASKFIIISSVLGQIADSMPYPYDGYGISKAGANYISKKIDQQEPRVISFPMHPGAVETDMGTSGAAAYGISLKDMGGITATQSAQGILSVVDAATKETHGGKFWSYNGDEMTY